MDGWTNICICMHSHASYIITLLLAVQFWRVVPIYEHRVLLQHVFRWMHVVPNVNVRILFEIHVIACCTEGLSHCVIALLGMHYVPVMANWNILKYSFHRLNGHNGRKFVLCQPGAPWHFSTDWKWICDDFTWVLKIILHLQHCASIFGHSKNTLCALPDFCLCVCVIVLFLFLGVHVYELMVKNPNALCKCSCGRGLCESVLTSRCGIISHAA